MVATNGDHAEVGMVKTPLEMQRIQTARVLGIFNQSEVRATKDSSILAFSDEFNDRLAGSKCNNSIEDRI
jgi:hypothetical protein